MLLLQFASFCFMFFWACLDLASLASRAGVEGLVWTRCPLIQAGGGSHLHGQYPTLLPTFDALSLAGGFPPWLAVSLRNSVSASAERAIVKVVQSSKECSNKPTVRMKFAVRANQALT